PKSTDVTAKTNAVNYTLVASNVAGMTTSLVARVVIIPDTFPPTLVSALTGPPPPTRASNQVDVTFSEKVDPASAGAMTNYTVSILGTTNIIPIMSVAVNNNLARLTLASGLALPTNYVVTV